MTHTDYKNLKKKLRPKDRKKLQGKVNQARRLSKRGKSADFEMKGRLKK